MKDWVKGAYIGIMGRKIKAKDLHVMMKVKPIGNGTTQIVFECGRPHPFDAGALPLQEWINQTSERLG